MVSQDRVKGCARLTKRLWIVLAEAVIGAVTVIIGWYAVFTGEASDSTAQAVFVSVAIASTIGVVMGVLAAWRGKHLMAGFGYLVGVVAPTVFAYLGNLLLLGFAVYELALGLQHRRKRMSAARL